MGIWKVIKNGSEIICEFMGWPYGCEVEVLSEVKFSRAEDKKGCGMVEEDRCVIEGSCKHFLL